MSNTEGAPPCLSVILMVDSQRARGERALASLLRQNNIAVMEILLLDMGGAGAPPLAGAEHPAVRHFALPRCLEYGTVMTFAVIYARAPVVAFMEEHCYARPGWADALIRAHAGPWAAVGAEIGTDSTHLIQDPIELISGGPWSPPAQRGEAPRLRWQNVAYKRARLLAFGALLADLLSAEGTLFQVLRRQGDLLYVEPCARLVHSHELEWRTFLRGTYISNRLHAARRARLLGYSPLQRGLRLANLLLTPARSLWTLRRRLLAAPTGPDRDRRLATFRACLPQLIGYYSVLAAASAVGLLCGEGATARQFLAYELNETRGFAPAPIE